MWGRPGTTVFVFYQQQAGWPPNVFYGCLRLGQGALSYLSGYRGLQQRRPPARRTGPGYEEEGESDMGLDEDDA